MLALLRKACARGHGFEFDRALKIASQGDRGAYIEVVTDKYAAPPLALKLHESVKTLYRT
jgi:indolepyruvate decarboxylase